MPAPNNIHRAGEGASPAEWYASLPLVTKVFTTSLIMSAASVQFGMIDAMNLVFHWPSIWTRFEIWRLFTPFVFAGGFGLPFAMHTYMTYNQCMRYESNPFNTGAGGSSADFIWMLIIAMTLFCVYAAYSGDRVLSTHVLYSIVYVQSRRNPDSVVSMFGFRFMNAYIPWVYVGINMLMSNPILPSILGIIVGHIYYFLVEALPNTQGFDIVRTPQFCEDLARLGGDPAAAARAPSPQGFRRTGPGSHWSRAGRGQALGSR